MEGLVQDAHKSSEKNTFSSQTTASKLYFWVLIKYSLISYSSWCRNPSKAPFSSRKAMFHLIS